MEGKKYYVIKEKFRLLKERLKWWNNNVFGWVDLKIDDGVDSLNDLEKEMINFGLPLSSDQHEKRKAASESIWQHLHIKESLIR